ncbi:MAG: hypothetical protein WCD18_15910 [Thermosynechococcaceae cyanobacterium]
MRQEIRGLTLIRPWGTATALHGKRIENRTKKFPLPVGTFIAIHNGNKWDADGAQFIKGLTGITIDPIDDPAGCIIAIAQFSGMVTQSTDPWFFGPYGWRWSKIVPIQPVPCKGDLGLWKLNSATLKAVRDQYQEASKVRSEI